MRIMKIYDQKKRHHVKQIEKNKQIKINKKKTEKLFTPTH